MNDTALSSAVQSLPEVLASAATLWPKRPALRASTGTMNLIELRNAVETVADALLKYGVQPGMRVGVCVKRGIWPLLASAAIMRLGGIYVPLSPGEAVDRLRFVIEDAALSLALADPAGELALESAGVEVFLLKDDLYQSDETVNLPPMPDSRTPAYIIYTSGSTGRPKGVQVEHRNVIAMLEGMLASVELTAEELWPLLHAHTFDVSVWEMWGGIAAGACLLTMTDDTVNDPFALAHTLAVQGVTTLNVVPSIFRHLAAAVVDQQRAVHLKNVILAGERLNRAPIRNWRALPGGTETCWYNVYGATETTVHNCLRKLETQDLEGELYATPIGRPLAKSSMTVVGPDLHAVPRGTQGQFAIGGEQVARNYLNRPDLTEERFRSLPNQEGTWYLTGDAGFMDDNADFHYVGRIDDQVKVLGVRIELGEVEYALRRLEWVRDAVVLALPTGTGENQLQAFLELTRPLDSSGTLREKMRDALAVYLPEMMIPQRVSVVDAFPQTTSGKVDRRKLGQTAR